MAANKADETGTVIMSGKLCGDVAQKQSGFVLQKCQEKQLIKDQTASSSLIRVPSLCSFAGDFEHVPKRRRA